ncbi:MAG: hypothetical protein EA419_07830 [Wenzhouxiangella sp.]|nr:MAG: hypothetical protein EA419_07830 [Wenzhouxiangella sp.]
MKLTRLEIRRLPGIDRPFSVQFAADTVNLITGPNGSGKSSLIRATRALLHPRADEPYLELSAQWLDDQGSLSCERSGQRVQWQRHGQIVDAPKLPGPEAMGAYLVSSEDLAALGQTETHIAAELNTILAGGYDLGAVLSSPPFTPPARPQKLAREVETLQRAIGEKEAEYSALYEELQKLGRLESELHQATRSAGLLSAIDDALALADGITRRAALEATLIDEFPGGMDRMRGDEMDRLEQARQRLEKKRQALAIEQAALDEDSSQLERTGVDDPADLEALQSQLADARNALAQTEQDLSAANDQVAVAEQALAQAARRLGSDQPEQVERLNQETLESLERQVERVLGLREKIRALSGQLMLAQGSRNPSGRPQEALRTARSALQEWLQLARLNPLEGVLWGSLGIAALLGSLRLLSAERIASNPELLLLVGLAVGLPLALLVRFFLRLRDRERARARYLETDIEAPLGWSESEVVNRLERLETELEAARQHEVSLSRAGDLREQLNVQRNSLERARAKFRGMAEELGISADPRLETGFLLWCRHLQDWQHNAQRLNEQRLRLESLESRQRRQREEAARLLKAQGLEADEISSRQLAKLVHQLAPRVRRHTELHQSVQARRRRVAELQSDIDLAEQQISQIFESAGIRDDDLSSLRQKSEQFPAWQQLEQELRELRREVTRLEKRLVDQPDLLEQARKPHRQALEALRQATEQRAERRDQLNRRIAEIHTRHADTLKRRELERLGTELDALRDRLAGELDNQMVAAAGRYLIEEVETAHRAEHEPAMLVAADLWLDSFTGHRYRLIFEAGQFSALDTRSGRQQALDELSTGTRVQLMLAVRLAWIEQQERHTHPLPVFLDEVLTTTDADRYRAVVGAVGALVAAGRQVFYLTAQNDDARAWWEWLGDDLEPHAIDMADIRRGEVVPLSAGMPESGVQERSLPDPGSVGPDEWAQAVGVDPIDPWQASGQIHLVHVLRDDLGLADRLLRLGLERLGELERLIERLETAPAGDPPLTSEEAATLRQRVQAAALILDDWRNRHPRPVDTEVLQRCGLLSERFLPQVGALAEKIGGHPGRLIERLEEGAVPRFRSEVIEQLRQWLADEGFPARRAGDAPLTAGEIALETALPVDQAGQLRSWLEAAIRDPLG